MAQHWLHPDNHIYMLRHDSQNDCEAQLYAIVVCFECHHYFRYFKSHMSLRTRYDITVDFIPIFVNHLVVNERRLFSCSQHMTGQTGSSMQVSDWSLVIVKVK